MDRMKTLSTDNILAIIVVVGAAIYLWADSRLPVANMADPLGPKAFPVLVGCGLLLSAAIIFLEGRKKQRGAKGETGERRGFDRRQALTIVGMLVWTILYYATFETLGYLIATPIFLFGLLCHFHRNKYLINVAISIGFTLIAYALFSMFLHVPLPTGPLPL
jgi:putative tricarboxylic transport membrane protein